MILKLVAISDADFLHLAFGLGISVFWNF